jgi:hypothetical protein
VATDGLVFAGRIASMRKMHERLKAAGISAFDEQGVQGGFSCVAGDIQHEFRTGGVSWPKFELIS